MSIKISSIKVAVADELNPDNRKGDQSELKFGVPVVDGCKFVLLISSLFVIAPFPLASAGFDVRRSSVSIKGNGARSRRKETD